MNVRLQTLTLLCRKAEEVISLDSNVVLLSGPVSVGKSSALNLIDYCFGGSYDDDWAPVIRNEVISVRLDAQLGSNQVVLERSLAAQHVDVTWSAADGGIKFLQVPIAAGQGELFPNVYGLSDLLFYLCGTEPIKVPRRVSDPESPLIRLSFRDLMWFCYLPQDRLDSNFFNLYDPALRPKARWAMRYFTGLYSERLSVLEQRLEDIRLERASVEASATQLDQALTEVGDGASLEDLKVRRVSLEQNEASAQAMLDEVTQEYRAATHAVDDIRERLRVLYHEIADREAAIDAQRVRFAELVSLRAEYVSLKLRAERSLVALTIIGDTSFRHCPQCGRQIEALPAASGCSLCKASNSASEVFDADALRTAGEDLSQQIVELEDAIQRQEQSISLQHRQLMERVDEKTNLDQELQEVLAEYDSAYVSRLRQGERRLSSIGAALASVNNLLKLYANLERYRTRFQTLAGEMTQVRQSIAEEMRLMRRAQEIIDEIQTEFYKVLRMVGVPGVDAGDRIRLNSQNWIPWVTNDANPEEDWDYRSASSGGKRVLFVVCFALALHTVAEKNNLPVPSLLMIDTPTKNVERDINRSLVSNIQRAIFSRIGTTLGSTQVIVANGTFEDYPFEIEPIRVRLTPERGLVPYYREARQTQE